jgi:hypothetical protein
MHRGLVEFPRICPFKPAYVAGEFNNSRLHSQAYAQKRYVVFPDIAARGYHSFDASLAKTSGNYYSAYVRKNFADIFICNIHAVDPADVNIGARFKTSMV